MDNQVSRRRLRRRIHFRVRAKVKGSANRPRLAVYRSLRQIYIQAIDDREGHTLAAAGSLELESKAGGNVEAAKAVGKMMGERLIAKGIKQAVFDRGGFRFHGRVKAVADAVRETGVQF